jgi:hypothetical protein
VPPVPAIHAPPIKSGLASFKAFICRLSALEAA